MINRLYAGTIEISPLFRIIHFSIFSIFPQIPIVIQSEVGVPQGSGLFDVSAGEDCAAGVVDEGVDRGAALVGEVDDRTVAILKENGPYGGAAGTAARCHN
jgi:hypothetical protein